MSIGFKRNKQIPETFRPVPETLQESERPDAVEMVASPESVEGVGDAPQETKAGDEQSLGEFAPAAPATQRTAVSAPKDRFTKEIESILSADLTEAFLAMNPQQRVAFKQKGEQTASKIRQLLATAHVHAKKVFSAIRDWLKMVPGINKYFLEQEAKIKTDRLLALAEEEMRRNNKDLS